ncbi:hypothetical protein, partial [Streptomyces sp. I05A-00742]|uniref:hypothetical protein n=1 Tax=Streptomyces sp. I05A-00742 TaxID=2732853 RepID=UPI001BB22E57
STPSSTTAPAAGRSATGAGRPSRTGLRAAGAGLAGSVKNEAAGRSPLSTARTAAASASATADRLGADAPPELASPAA